MNGATVDTSIVASLRSAAALHRAGDAPAALLRYLAILEREPNCFDALHLIGVLELQRGKPEAALAWFDRAIAAAPTIAAAHVHRGAALREMKRCDEALAALDEAIALQPNNVGALSNRAAVQLDQGNAAAALADADRALSFEANHAVALYNRMSALRKLGRWRDALITCERVAQLLPGNAELQSHLGGLLREAGRAREALQAYDRSLAMRPFDPALWCNRGHVLVELGQHDAAVEDYRRAYAMDPTIPHLPGWLVHAKLRVADWQGLPELHDEIKLGIDECRPVCEPFVSLLLPLSRNRLRRCAEIHSQRLTGAVLEPPVLPAVPAERIRVGYFSADFHDHPTAQLIAGVLEHHDRARFEVTAFSLGPPIEDAMRSRLHAGVDRFVDLHNVNDTDAAQIARQLGVDIAIDLGGYTRACRSGIFVNRAAPIQVAWLGFAGTLGASFIDYVIADDVVAPAAHEREYAEAIIRLPNCYQPNDAKRSIAPRTPSREEAGLPEDAFVFCCFNNPAKLTPEVFDVWMGLLRRLPNTVLWLLDDNVGATSRLRQHAISCGVDSTRLIFAPRLPTAEHLARHWLADLFLDTWPYNAHTTASDALWSGLPVLTFMGETFPSRVAASLLRAVSMPELIVESAAEYEALAFELATDSTRLNELRQRLIAQRSTQPLFDTAGFTRDLESSYLAIWNRRRQGW